MIQRSVKVSGLLAVAAGVLAGGAVLGAGTASAGEQPDMCNNAVTKTAMVKVADEPLALGAIANSSGCSGGS